MSCLSPYELCYSIEEGVGHWVCAPCNCARLCELSRKETETQKWLKASHGNAGVWKAWKAIKPAFHPSHTPWKSLRGFPHYHGYDDGYHESEDRQSPPKTRNQSHSYRKGLVNHVPGLKRKGCPGTLTP
jgi:hypothetical protein